MRPLPAFLRSGRFSVTVTTPPSRSTMMVSVLTATPYPPPPARPQAAHRAARAPGIGSEGVFEHLDLEGPARPRSSPRPRRSEWSRSARRSRRARAQPQPRHGCAPGAAWPAVTASKGEPKRAEVRVFTSQNTRTSPVGAAWPRCRARPRHSASCGRATSYAGAPVPRHRGLLAAPAQGGTPGTGHVVSCRGRAAVPRSRPGR